ncbi:MAG: HAD family hydrolase [Acidobacteriota bacterium]
MALSVETFLLDIGQVLVALDFEGFLKSVHAQSELSLDEMTSRFNSSGELYLYETGRLATPDFVDRISQLLAIRLPIDPCQAWGTLFTSETENLISPEFFRRLKEQYRVIALSNTNALHFEYLRTFQPLVNEFDDYVLSYEVGSVKPESEIYHAALSKAQNQPHEVIFVDDRPENIAAAQALGITGIVFQNERQLKQDLATLGVEL